MLFLCITGSLIVEWGIRMGRFADEPSKETLEQFEGMTEDDLRGALKNQERLIRYHHAMRDYILKELNDR